MSENVENEASNIEFKKLRSKVAEIQAAFNSCLAASEGVVTIDEMRNELKNTPVEGELSFGGGGALGFFEDIVAVDDDLKAIIAILDSEEVHQMPVLGFGNANGSFLQNLRDQVYRAFTGEAKNLTALANDTNFLKAAYRLAELAAEEIQDDASFALLRKYTSEIRNQVEDPLSRADCSRRCGELHL